MKRTTLRRHSVLALSWWLVAMTTSGGSGKAFGQISDGACCLPDASCSVRNVFSCTSAGGTFRGGTTCVGVVCTGACCRADGNCQAGFSQLSCTSASGAFLGIASACAGQTCGGACCQGDGTCRISNSVACSGSEVFHGLGSECADVDCAGACCDVTGNCRTSNTAACAAPEIFHGLESECADVDCAGACCEPTGDCVETSALDCADRSGVFLGLEAECQDAVCVGACCLPNKGCTLTGFGPCPGLLGVFQGLGSVCGDDCPTVMPTAFTYQGQLKRNGVPHKGLIDARFSLWLSPEGEEAGGNRVSSYLHVLDLQVVNGLFSVELDFRADVFNGNARWLEVQIMDHDDPSGEFTTLSPRQPLTPVPYALQTRGIVVRQDGSVGIGTKLAQSPLHVAGESLRDGGLSPGVHIALDGRRDAKIELVTATPGLDGGYIDFTNDQVSDFDARIRLTTNNDLSIEGANLRVADDIKMNLGVGERFAAGGVENLRIVRGTVNSDGTLNRGLGFTVAFTVGEGYLITFVPPFSASPSMTVTWEYSIGATPLFAAADNVGASTARVVLEDTSELIRPGPFHFIAVGPR